MNWRLVCHILGALALVLAGMMLPSLGIALWGEADPMIARRAAWAFVGSAAVSLAAGALLMAVGRGHGGDRLYAEDGFVITACGWVLMAVLGAVPFMLCRDFTMAADLVAANAVGSSPGPQLTFMDALFESMSGFTTTGSSVFGTPRGAGGLGVIEAIPRSLLFWRSLTHWLGGMGIIVLCLAILPALRAGGYQMFSAEVPGPTADRLRPRIRQTAAILWGVYCLFSIAQTVLLRLGGMPVFDALCHTFGTMATGGFSTKDASIGHYAAVGDPSALYFEIVINIFMFLAGCNFLFHYRALRGDFSGYRRDGEVRFYAAVLGASTAILTGMLMITGTMGDWGTAIRQVVFQTLSITTTTGFATADFDLWPHTCRFLLLGLMFFGGCAGSTGGGLKQIRILIMFKYVRRELVRLLRPRLTNPLRSGDAVVADRTVRIIVSLVFLYGIIFVAATLLVLVCLDLQAPVAAGDGAVMAPDSLLVTAASSVAATLNNIGPGLSSVGATANYGWMPQSVKFILFWCMMMGRLEVYAVVVMFLPLAWRR